MAKQCIDCGKPISRSSKLGRCKSCAGKARWQRPEYQKQIKAARKASWEAGAYDNRKEPKNYSELCKMRSQITLEKWQDPEYVERRRETHSRAMQSPKVRAKIGANSKKLWKDPKYRAVSIEARKALWENTEFRERRVIQIRAMCQTPRWKAAHTFIGPNHPNWRGGDTEYGPEFNKELRHYIRKRDNHTCTICGKRAKCVHHIDYNKTENSPENLITLCRKCHGKTNVRRHFWRTILAPVARRREEAWTN